MIESEEIDKAGKKSRLSCVDTRCIFSRRSWSYLFRENVWERVFQWSQRNASSPSIFLLECKWKMLEPVICQDHVRQFSWAHDKEIAPEMLVFEYLMDEVLLHANKSDHAVRTIIKNVDFNNTSSIDGDDAGIAVRMKAVDENTDTSKNQRDKNVDSDDCDGSITSDVGKTMSTRFEFFRKSCVQDIENLHHLREVFMNFWLGQWKLQTRLSFLPLVFFSSNSNLFRKFHDFATFEPSKVTTSMFSKYHGDSMSMILTKPWEQIQSFFFIEEFHQFVHVHIMLFLQNWFIADYVRSVGLQHNDLYSRNIILRRDNTFQIPNRATFINHFATSFAHETHNANDDNSDRGVLIRKWGNSGSNEIKLRHLFLEITWIDWEMSSWDNVSSVAQNSSSCNTPFLLDHISVKMIYRSDKKTSTDGKDPRVCKMCFTKSGSNSWLEWLFHFPHSVISRMQQNVKVFKSDIVQNLKDLQAKGLVHDRAYISSYSLKIWKEFFQKTNSTMRVESLEKWLDFFFESNQMMQWVVSTVCSVQMPLWKRIFLETSVQLEKRFLSWVVIHCFTSKDILKHAPPHVQSLFQVNFEMTNVDSNKVRQKDFFHGLFIQCQVVDSLRDFFSIIQTFSTTAIQLLQTQVEEMKLDLPFLIRMINDVDSSTSKDFFTSFKKHHQQQQVLMKSLNDLRIIFLWITWLQHATLWIATLQHISLHLTHSEFAMLDWVNHNPIYWIAHPFYISHFVFPTFQVNNPSTSQFFDNEWSDSFDVFVGLFAHFCRFQTIKQIHSSLAHRNDADCVLNPPKMAKWRENSLPHVLNNVQDKFADKWFHHHKHHRSCTIGDFQKMMSDCGVANEQLTPLMQ